MASHRRIASGPLPGAATVLAAGPDARVVAVHVPGGRRLLDTATGKWTGPARVLPSSYRIGFGPSGRSYAVRDPRGGRTYMDNPLVVSLGSEA
ncbi:hypothetical protein [Streptomyces sp. NPDC001100]